MHPDIIKNLCFSYDFRREKVNCGALRNLVPFAQFKKVKNAHGAVLLLVKYKAKPATLLKSNTPPWFFLRFLYCLNGTKSHNVSQLIRFKVKFGNDPLRVLNSI